MQIALAASAQGDARVALWVAQAVIQIGPACVGRMVANAAAATLDGMFSTTSLSGRKPEQYAQLLDQARALMHGERDRVANAANLSALLWQGLPDLNWCGFYFFDGRELVVGPFQGLPACVRIPLDKGVCGVAARTRQTQRVADVDAFAGHVACDSASRSELVLPLVAAGGDSTLIGVLDLDSPILERFDNEDQQGLEAIAQAYVESLV